MSNIQRLLVTAAIKHPETAIPEARSVGMLFSDMMMPYSGYWQQLCGRFDNQEPIDGTIASEVLGIDSMTIEQALEPIMDLRGYAREIVESALSRELKNLGVKIETNVAETAVSLQQKIDNISARLSQARNPAVVNPAEALERADGWVARYGNEFLDSLLAMSSGSVHFLAGDPGCGKTTIGAQTAVFNAMQNRPVLYIAAEDTVEEIQLAMVCQLGRVPVDILDKLMYDPHFKDPDWIEKVRTLWDEQLGGKPLQIRTSSQGPSEVLALIGSMPRGSLIIVDHVRAVVAQVNDPYVKEHQQYTRFYSGGKLAARRGNHVILFLNQYTKEARKGTERDADDEYGGSFARNVASSMTHLWELDDASPAGVKACGGWVCKIRSRLVVDENGFPVDPLKDKFIYYLDQRYRQALARPTLAGEI